MKKAVESAQFAAAYVPEVMIRWVKEEEEQ